MALKTSFTIKSDDASLCAAGVVTPNTQKLTLIKWRDGNELPNWKQIIADGGNATTRLSAYEDTLEISPGRWTGSYNGDARYWGQQQGIQSLVTPTFAPTKDIVSTAKAMATSRSYDIINRMLSELQGQVFLGELRETIKLLKNPLAQSKKLWDAFYYKGKGKVGDELAALWLQYQFGMRPLLSDVDSIMQLVNDTVEKTSRKTFRAYGQADDTAVTSYYGTFDVYGWYQRRENHKIWKAQYVIRFAVSQEYLDMANEVKTNWRSQFDQVSAIPMTAWELVPFSFLLDYFVNVSDIIQAAVTSTSGVTYWSNCLIKTAIDRQIGSTDGVKSGRVINSNIPRVVTSTRRWVDRDGSALGIPSVQFSLPGSNIRYLNIAALATVLTAEMRRARK